VNAIGLVGDRLVSASGDTMIKMWDVRTGRCLREFAGHTRGLACVKYDGTKIVSGSSDKMIKVWEAEVRQRLIECACID
jgi:F-box and WD-40 domain protein 1/11